MQKNNPSLIIRTMRIEDIDAVVDIHRRCFSDKVSLFSVLHRRLAWHLYAQYVEELHSIGLVLEDIETGKIAGYAAGTLRPGFDRRFLWSHFPLVAWSVLVGLATHRTVWRMFFRSLLTHDPFGDYRQHPDRYEPEPPAGPVGYFMPIAMNPDYRGGGHAVRLAAALEDYFFDLGVDRIRGNKIAIDNLASRKLFVEKLGWQSRTIENHCVIVWKDNERSKKSNIGSAEKARLSENQFIYRDMTLADLESIGRIHQKCFPSDQSIFSVLHPRVAQSLYEIFVLDRRHVGVVCEDLDSGRVCGFSTGTMKDEILKQFLTNNKRLLVREIIKTFFSSSTVRYVVIANLLQKKGKVDFEGAEKTKPGGTVGIFRAIAVGPDYRGKGIASSLINCTVKRLVEMGAVRIRGNGIKTHNQASKLLFERLGWNVQQVSNEWYAHWLDIPEKLPVFSKTDAEQN